MGEWKETEFAKILEDESISYGIVQPGSHVENGIPIIRVQNIKNGKIIPDDIKKVHKDIESSYLRTRLSGGELLITVVGSVGECAIVPNEYIGWNVARAVSVARIKRTYDIEFVRYCFATEGLKFQMYGNTNDTVQPTLNLKELKALKLLMPELNEQKAIAEVLTSLDDKIDLLSRQNKTLESMAEILFRQWFVEEKVKMMPLAECIQTTSGGTPSRKKMEYYEDGTIQWIKSKELNRGYLLDTEEKITEEAISNSSAKLLPENSVLIAMYGATVGEYAIIGQEASCNQAICACIPNDDFPYTYIYHMVKSYQEELINMAVGSAQQNISQVLIKGLDIPVDEKKIKLFHEEVDPMMKKIRLNYKHMNNLKNMRDTLLPKLMNGEITVKVD